MDATTWSEEEFGSANLGHLRRTRRLCMVARGLADRPGGKMTRVFEISAELEGTYRFLENPDVSVDEMERARGEACARRLSTETLTIVPIDQSSIRLEEHRRTTRFGSIGNRKGHARGLYLMTAVPLDTDGVMQGVLYQRRWLRSEKRTQPRLRGRNDKRRDNRPAQRRESFEWIRVLDGCDAQLREHAPDARVWYQCDQAADYWRVFAWAHEHRALLTARISHERVVLNDGHANHLHPWIARRPVAYHYDLELMARTGDHPHAARVAHLSVRYGTTTLALAVTKSRRRNIAFSVVAVTEPHPPAGVKPIDWLLLTTYPVLSDNDARLAVHNYTLRWRAEEFHHTLKTGALDIEASELQTFEGFSRLLVVASSVAARIEHIKLLSRTQPDLPATVAYSREEIELLIRLRQQQTARKGLPFRPRQIPSLGQVTRWVAELGGYRPSRSRGPPGTVVLARGLLFLMIAVLGARATRGPPRTRATRGPPKRCG